MNWDHPIHSFTDPNAEPHTPTRSPTTAAFAESFQTPKLESSFYDPRVTWNTADPYGSSPEFPKTPQRFVHGQARHYSDANLESTPSTFVQPQLPLQPPQQQPDRQEHQFSPVVGRSAHIDLSQNAATTSAESGPWGHLGQQDGWPDLDNNDSAYSVMKRSAASMQTPPPTSSSRRKLQSQTNPQTPRASATVHFNQETPTRGIGLSPDLFAVQSSPGLFQLPGNPAATTSPFFSQQPMPWDQEPELPSAPIGSSSAYGDPFSLPQQPHANEGEYGSLNQVANSSMQPRQSRLPPNSNDFGQGPSASAYLDVDDGAAVATSFFTSPRVPPTHDEDPAMFLSSPARRFGFQASEISPVAPGVETRQPYHFQTEESERNKREKELRKLQRAKTAARRQQQNSRDEGPMTRPYTVSGRSSKRPSLNTAIPSSASHGRNPSLPSSAASGSVASGSISKSSPSKGRLSPVKAHLQSSHSRSVSSAATVSAPMESVVLKIGKDGRAKTEMITQPAPHSAHPDAARSFDDSSSTENDSDSSENDQPLMSFNQDMSFNVPDSTQLNSSAGRGSSRSRPHSKSSSYSSTVGSSHSGRHSPWAGSSRGSGNKRVDVRQREGWMHQRRHSINPRIGGSRGPSSTDSDVTQEEAYYNENDESGDAQHALMKVLKQRSRPSSARKQTGYRTVGRSIQPQPPHTQAQPPAPPPPTTLPSSPPVYRAHQEIRPKGFSSPAQATVYRPTPKPGRHSNPISGTRCVCNSQDNGGHLMIQCETCTHWLHTKCVGLDRQSLPAVYVCIYCAQTPKQVGGHVREPVSAGPQASSPLARKSFQAM